MRRVVGTVVNAAGEPVAAALAMSLSSLMVVGNSLRLRRLKI